MTDESIHVLIDDCLLKVFSYLSIADVLNAQKVCRRWAALCKESWKKVKHFSRYNGKWYLGQKLRLKGEHEVMCLNDLKYVLTYCGPFIRNVFLDREEHPNDHEPFMTTVTMISQYCKNLQDIVINEFLVAEAKKNNLIDRNWERSLSKFLNEYRELESFSLCGETAMTGEFMKYLPDNLKKLEISFSRHVQSCHVIDALKKFNRLHSFSGYKVSDSIAGIIGDMETITTLRITDSYKLSSSFNYLANLVNLVSLDLGRNNSLVDDNFIIITSNCKQLKILDISYCHQLKDRGIAGIANLPKLEDLIMLNLETITDEPLAYFPDTLKQLLCYECKRIKDRGMIRLMNRAQQLRLLHINECSSITNKTIEAAIEVTKIRTNNFELVISTRGTQVDVSKLEEKYGLDIKKKSPLLTVLHT